MQMTHPVFDFRPTGRPLAALLLRHAGVVSGHVTCTGNDDRGQSELVTGRICVYVCLSVRPSVRPSVYLFVRPLGYLSVSLSI